MKDLDRTTLLIGMVVGVVIAAVFFSLNIVWLGIAVIVLSAVVSYLVAKKVAAKVAEETVHKVADDSGEWTLNDLETGGSFDFMDESFTVKNIACYFFGQRERFEVKSENMFTKKQAVFEYEGNKKNMNVTVNAEDLMFSDLKDSQGKRIDEEDMDRILEGDGKICCNGATYVYREQFEAEYKDSVYDEDDPKVSELYICKFRQEDNSDSLLQIEEWGAGEGGSNDYQYKIRTLRKIDQSEISIMTLNDSNA